MAPPKAPAGGAVSAASVARPRPAPTRKQGRETRQRSHLTQQKLLAGATKLFAERGYQAVSVRAIAAAAGVNSALVAYHFGTKEGLFEEVIRAATSSHVADRLHLISQAARQGRPIPLPTLLDIYFRPLLAGPDSRETGAVFGRLHSVLSSERPDLFESIAARIFNSLNVAFLDELQHALPHLSRHTLVWRLYAMIGACLFLEVRPSPPGMATLSAGRCSTEDPEEFIRQILPFFENGLPAPEPVQPRAAKPAASAAEPRRARGERQRA